MTQRHTYIVTLSAAPGSTRDESIRALRAALKCLVEILRFAMRERRAGRA